MSTVQVSRSALGGRRAWSRDPGRAIPAALWAAAVEVADTEGLSTTARAMGVDRQRLCRQLGDRSAMAVRESSTSFVELDACSVFEQVRALARLTLRDGAHLEVVLDGCAADMFPVAVHDGAAAVSLLGVRRGEGCAQ